MSLDAVRISRETRRGEEAPERSPCLGGGAATRGAGPGTRWIAARAPMIGAGVRSLRKGAPAWGEARRHGEQAPERDGSPLGAQADRRGCRRRRGRPANAGTAGSLLEVPARLDAVIPVLWPIAS